ncbi:MAG: hypothetical protein QGG36_01030 [Pirellulaceae bacterium]|jgi:hypothetical protein|nr:hypothetical protein [Pirellulaceae bacterium]
MKRALLTLAALLVVFSVGCQRHNLRTNGCKSCDNDQKGGKVAQGDCKGGNCGGCASCYGATGEPGRYGLFGNGNPDIPRLPRGSYPGMHTGGPAGPPTAAVASPYYTTHGPRDFLMNNPPPLGY